MADRLDAWTVFLAWSLAIALLMSLSEPAWQKLLLFWLVFTPPSVMAYLEPLRRGVTRRGGGLSSRLLAALLLRGAALGLLFASLILAFLNM